MRHQKAGRRLGRTASHRNAMFRNMVTSLFQHGRIQTTDAKAKELRRWADQMITLAKRGDLHARRQALAVIRDKKVVHKLFEEAQKRFGGRAGGYTQIVKLGRRRGDAALMSLVELVTAQEKKKKKPKKAAKKGAEKPKKKAEVKGKEDAAPRETAAAEEAEEEAVPKREEEALPEAEEKGEERVIEEAPPETEAEAKTEEPEAQVVEPSDTEEDKEKE